MSCSYEELFTTDNSRFKVQSRYDCYSNFPIVISLPPHARTDRYIMVTRTNKNDTVNVNKLKVGMYFSVPKREANYTDIINLYDHRKNAQVIWSNELDLKRLNGTLY